MTVIYVIGLMLALLAGGGIGWFLIIAYLDRVAWQSREYEREMEEAREFHVAAALLRRAAPADSVGDTGPPA
jgi:hypothetical protein